MQTPTIAEPPSTRDFSRFQRKPAIAPRHFDPASELAELAREKALYQAADRLRGQRPSPVLNQNP